MHIRIGINGFGRIGRLVCRSLIERYRDLLNIVAINDLAPLETNIHLLNYDSVHGRFPYSVERGDGCLWIDGQKVQVYQEKHPEALPWHARNVDIVLECSGRFTRREDAEKHIHAGAKKVLVSAPATHEDLTVVYGVNHEDIRKEHTVISNASCTTNCLVPVALVLHQAIGIEHGFMTTVHSYTGDQSLVDTGHKDLSRARAAGLNMIPTSTGAARAVGLVLPALQGKIDGTAIRVPTANVSLIDFTFTAKRKTSVEEVNNVIKDAATSERLKDILGYYDIPLVSSDFNHDSRSSVVGLHETKVIGGMLVRVLSWYDNEWGFACRMCDTALRIAEVLESS